MRDKNNWYRLIPKVDTFLEKEVIKDAISVYGRTPVLEIIQEQIALIRHHIGKCQCEEEVLRLLEELECNIRTKLQGKADFSLKKVINATGVILHTNLGRAPVNRNHVEKLIDSLAGYSNLEYNLKEGKRGERYSHFENIICKVTGAEAAIAVNNNAAAVLLIISAVCVNKEVIVSRGEQVEIGGKFRIPDIILQSGAQLVEVGTTNRTRISDYEEHINENTGAILKVHTSNYRIMGFTESVNGKELEELAARYEIPVIEDLGSGVLIDLSKYGLPKEPTVMESIQNGIDLVSFSGDKLLGGPQAGIIIGKKKWIDLLKKHPLMRAIRIDKYTASMLEMTFACYEDERFAMQQIPVLSMLTKSMEEMNQVAEELIRELEPLKNKYLVEIVDCISMSGGGALPGEQFQSRGVAISGKKLPVNRVEEDLRKQSVPIIIRVDNEKILIDMRTIWKEDIPILADELMQVLS